MQRKGLCDVNSFELFNRLYGYILIITNPMVKKVEDIGVEPMTLCVQGRCSSQLS